MLEPRTLAYRLPRLAELFKQEREISINELERGFTSFNDIEAALAYDESLVTAQYIRDTYGMGDVLRILDRIGQGDSTESAMRAAIHEDYRQLENDLRTYLVRQAGN